MKKTQFSLILANKTGELARLAKVLAEAQVNMEALAISEGIHTGVVRVVVDAPDRARQALQQTDIAFSEQRVLAVELPNEPGALADLCEKLAADGQSIDYVYGSTPTGGNACGSCRLMLAIADLASAELAAQLASSGWPRP
jgi:hypothetical protein